MGCPKLRQPMLLSRALFTFADMRRRIGAIQISKTANAAGVSMSEVEAGEQACGILSMLPVMAQRLHFLEA
jgi:hypothetical protein